MARRDAEQGGDAQGRPRLRRRLRRWLLRSLLLLAVALPLAVVGLLHTSPFRAWAERQIETLLSDRLGAPVHLELTELSPLRLRARVARVTIAGPEGPGGPFLTLDEALIDARWSAVLDRRIDLSRLALAGLMVDLDRVPPGLGGDPAFDAAAADAGPLEIPPLLEFARIDQASVEGATIRGSGAAVSLRLGGLSVALGRVSDAPRYEVRLDARDGVIDVQDGPRSTFSVESTATLGASGVEVAAKLGSPSLAAAGWEVRGLELRAELAAEALTLDALQADFVVQLDALVPPGGEAVALATRATGSFDGETIVLEALRADAPGLEVRASGTAGLETETTLQAELRIADPNTAQRLLRPLLGQDAMSLPPEADARGTLFATATIHGPGLSELRGPGELRIATALEARGLTLAGAAGLPLDVDARAQVHPATATLTAGDGTITGPGLEFAVDGSVDLAGGEVDLSAGGRLRLDAATAGRVQAELAAWGLAPDPALAEGLARLRGTLDLRADLRGGWPNPAGRVVLTGEGLHPEGVEETRNLEIVALLDGKGIEAHGLLEGGGGTLTARWHAGRLAPVGQATVALTERRPGWWAAFAASDVEARGTLEAHADIDVGARRAQGTIELVEAEIAGVRLELRLPSVSVTPERIELDGGRLAALGAEVRIDGTMARGSDSRLRLRAGELELARLVRELDLPLELELAGTLAVDAEVTGSPSEPRGEARLQLDGLVVAGQPLGDLRGTLRATGELATLRVMQGGRERVVATLQPQPPWRWTLDVDTPVELEPETGAQAVTVVVSGRLTGQLAGNLGDGSMLETLDGQVALEQPAIVWNDRRLTGEVVRVTLSAGRARLEPLRIGDDSAQIAAQGRMSLGSPWSWHLEASGELPLKLLGAAFGSGFDAGGLLALNLAVDGTPTDPRIDGTARLQDVSVRSPALPAPITGLFAVLDFDGTVLEVRELSGRMGPGMPITGGGRVVLAGPDAGAAELSLQGEQVWLPLDEGMRAQVDADLRLIRTPEGEGTISGEIDIIRAIYLREIDVQQRLLARSRAVGAGTELGGLLDRLRLDIDVDTPGTLYVRNKLASLSASADLDVGGTAAAPMVTGEVTLQAGGRVEFRDVTYILERGRLNYVSDPPADPWVDVTAETSVADYAVTLSVTGRLSDPRIQLTSDPPLPEADIVTLLVTGRTRDALSGSGSGFSDAQAAQYLTGDLTERVQKTLARALGFDDVRIDPSLLGSETNPSTRLTLGKTLTADLSFTYSRAIGGTQDDLYEVRYQPWDHWEFIGRRDEDDEYFADARYTQRFHVGPGGPEGDADARPDVIEYLAFPGAESIPRKVLVRKLGLREDRRFFEATLLEGLEAIRRRYVHEGYPEVEVDASVESVDGGTGVTIHVNEGRYVTVEIVSATEVDRSKLVGPLLERWQRMVFAGALEEDVEREAQQVLVERGFLRATVQAEVLENTGERVRLELSVAPGERVRVETIVVQGNDAIDDDRIMEQVLTETHGPFRRGWLYPQRLEEDRQGIRDLYLREGYRDATVEPEVRHPDSPAEALVVFTVAEGRRYHLGEVAFHGNEAFADARLLDELELRPGEPYSDEAVLAARRTLRRFYDEAGYAGVRIGVELRPDTGTAELDVAFTIAEGDAQRIRSIEIDAGGLTDEAVIRRHLTIEEGAPLSADDIADTRQNLYSTGLFRSVGVERQPVEGQPGLVDLRVSLVEQPNVRTSYGLGYATDEGPRATAEISHANLLGRLIYGATGVRVSGTRQRVFGVARQPRLFGSRLEGLVSAAYEVEERDAFDVTQAELTTQVDRKIDWLGRTFNTFAGYGLADTDVSGLSPALFPELPPEILDVIEPREESTLRLGRVFGGFLTGSPDDLAWPTSGTVVQATLDVFDQGLLSEAEFGRAFVQWSRYQTIGGGVLWNSAIRAGLSRPYGGTQLVPLAERFFTGGDHSIRGFKRDAIVPLGFPVADFGEPGAVIEGSLGGEALLVVNQELVVPAIDPVALVVFFDAGHVYWTRGDIDISRLRESAGLGIRARTPVGPLRLEYGWKLDREPGESPGRLHISIGLPF